MVKPKYNIVSNEYNKFWSKSIMKDTSDDDSSNKFKSTTTSIVPVEENELSNATSYEYTLSNNSHSSSERNTRRTPIQNQLSIFNSFDQSDLSSKRYQTKMLLASLIEHFCRVYGDTPDANRKVFFLICQTLRSLGIIDSEFVDEMTSVRSAFQKAFQTLFFTAVQTVRTQSLTSAELPKIKSNIQSDTSFTEDNLEDTPEPSSTSTHSFDFQNSCDQSLSRLETTKASSSNPSVRSFMAPDQFFNLSIQNSRYNNDFVEIDLLGKGGFASAFRARNRLDGISYAIKKIRLGSHIKESASNQHNPYEKIFREIKNLARLEHPNVIRYYSSWLEFDESNHAQGSDSSEDEDSLGSEISRNTDSSLYGDRDSKEVTESWNQNEVEESGMSHIEFGTPSTSGYNASLSQEGFTEDMSSVFDSDNDSAEGSDEDSNKTGKSKSGWTLFIQMQLCPITLHDYIKHRNKQFEENLSYDVIDARRNIEIFAQILEGTAYIHNEGLIHRDLKPGNIFLSMSNKSSYGHDTDGKRVKRTPRRPSSADPCLESTKEDDSSTHASSPESGYSFESMIWDESWVPKIGDFGLAAEVMNDEESGDNILMPTPVSSPPTSPTLKRLTEYSNNAKSKAFKRPVPRRTRTIGVGTRTYASPEQLAIPAQPYDEKVDIYSLGIILFELFQPFATGMERADSIEKLKLGVFPTGFLELYPKVSALILWMMDRDPNQRPSAHQLLEFELFSHPSAQDENALRLTLKSQLQSKINLIEKKDQEIDALRSRLDHLTLEHKQAMEDMQRKLEDLQSKLNSCVCQPNQPEGATSAKPKKGILSPTASFFYI